MKRRPLDIDLLISASEKADELQDIRFFFGRYQGLRKEDYCGLRLSDIDMAEEVIHLRRYDWQGQRRNLKLKEGGERTIPIHSELLWRIKKYLPLAATQNDTPKSGRMTTNQNLIAGVLDGRNGLGTDMDSDLRLKKLCRDPIDEIQH